MFWRSSSPPAMKLSDPLSDQRTDATLRRETNLSIPITQSLVSLDDTSRNTFREWWDKWTKIPVDSQSSTSQPRKMARSSQLQYLWMEDNGHLNVAMISLKTCALGLRHVTHLDDEDFDFVLSWIVWWFCWIKPWRYSAPWCRFL